MTIKVIKNQIRIFLESDIPEVLSITGEWGIGKTFSWGKFFKEEKKNNQIALNKYSYVSMFGINSLEEFKQEIFRNITNTKQISIEESVAAYGENEVYWKKLLWRAKKLWRRSKSLPRQSIGYIKDLPWVRYFNSLVESAQFYYLKETLICIDDLERKGGHLDLKDALGLISLLKEQKKCKIVLILNDKEIEEDASKTDNYKKYREKIVDIELKFAPTAVECAAIAYDGDDYVASTLKDQAEKLDIRNIRILKKIERLVYLGLPYLDGYDEKIKCQLIHSLTLFMWCKYDASNDAPDLDFVITFGKSISFDPSADNEESDDHKKWKTILSKYEYDRTDDLDLVLVDAVLTGYFVEEKMRQEVAKKNEEIAASKLEQSFSEAWHMYHDSFKDNQKDVINALYKGLKNGAKYVTPLNLNGTVALFRELGEDEKASELIDIYIDQRKDEKELFDVNDTDFFNHKPDNELIEKFNTVYSNSVSAKGEDAKQVLKRIAGSRSWHHSDEVLLANTTVEEYYKLFKAESGRHLGSYVATCLQFGNYPDANKEKKQITERVTEALKKIGEESEINRRRVKKHGVDVANAHKDKN